MGKWRMMIWQIEGSVGEGHSCEVKRKNLKKKEVDKHKVTVQVPIHDVHRRADRLQGV